MSLMPSKSERLFKQCVAGYLALGVYPSGYNINQLYNILLGYSGSRRVTRDLNGREYQWRREVCAARRISLKRGTIIPVSPTYEEAHRIPVLNSNSD